MARTLGMGDLTFFSRIHYGGGAACATVHQAAMAVASGVADVVVCYRAFNERSGHRFGTGVQGRAPIANAENAHFSWYAPQGLLTPASWVAMFAQRYLHVTGATTEDFGRVAVADRAFAATNPAAWFYGKPITLEDHQASRWIVEPAAPARLLPGVRRRPGHRGHQPRAGPRRRQAAGRASRPRPRARAPSRT